MDRSEVYTGEVPRSYDHLKAWTRIALGHSLIYSDLIGGVTSQSAAWGVNSALNTLNDKGGETTFPPANTAAGFIGPYFVGGFNYTLPALMQFNADVGTIYVAPSTGIDGLSGVPGAALTPTNSLAPGGTTVATDYGDLVTPNLSIAPVQCIAPPTNITGFVAPAAAHFNAYIVEAVPYQQDQTETDDPNYSAGGGTVANSAILPFYNSASPTTPLAGPGGTTPPTSSQTDRRPFGKLQLSSTSPYTSAVSLADAAAHITADANTIPLFLIVTQNGDTQLNAARVWAIGLGTCPTMNAQLTGYKAPFMRGLMNEHHLGVPGSAPQIDGSVEWKPTAAVPNNNQGFTNFSYLQCGASPITPSTAGAAGVVTGAGSSLTPIACTDMSGDIAIVLETAVGAWASGSNQLCTVTTATGRTPVSVAMALKLGTLSWASNNLLYQFFLTFSAAGGVITFFLFNGTNAGIANIANGQLRFTYNCMY